MLTIWTNKIKHSTVGSSFSVTFSVAPNELEYLNKLYDCFSSMNWSSLPIAADHKTENCSEIPNNCEDCIWSVCNYNKAFEDEPQTERPSCETCKWDSEEWYDRHCDSCVAHTDKPSNYEPQTDGYISGEDFMKIFDEPQTDCAWK